MVSAPAADHTLLPVSNERQGRGGQDLLVLPLRRVKAQVSEFKLYPASLGEPTVLRKEAT